MTRKLIGIAAILAIVAVSALPALASGEELYDKKCAMCHGKDGVAKKMAEGSANLNDPEWQKSTSVEAVVEMVKAGKGKMKGYEGKLSDEEIQAVAEYVMTLK